jgi:ABC-type phosphate/phosphonate transport system substrate-binding protein
MRDVNDRSERIVALPMYDLPELRGLTDEWWRGLSVCLRAQGVNRPPEELSRASSDEFFWRHPNLLLSQTCGYPFQKDYRSDLQLVATPVYLAPGCSGSRYVSRIIVGRNSPATCLDDLRNGRCAINNWASHSGMNALRHALASIAHGGRFFADVLVSGGHRHSIAMVASGAADVAAIDCVTFGLLQKHRPEEISGVRVLTDSAAAPGLPLVTAAAAPATLVEQLRSALFAAASAPELREVRDALLIGGFEVVPLAEYRHILDMEEEAIDNGYPHLV